MDEFGSERAALRVTYATLKTVLVDAHWATSRGFMRGLFRTEPAAAEINQRCMTLIEPANENTSLLDFHWVVVRFCGHLCTRSEDARLAGLAWRCGERAMLKWLLAQFRKPCAWDPLHRKPQTYGRKRRLSHGHRPYLAA